jgi:FMN phosphatase YigB (HAD superfamily)
VTKTAGLVLFDLDNTLADRAGAFARWARDFAAQQGIDAAGLEWLIQQDHDGSRPRHDFFEHVRRYFGTEATTDDLVVRYSRSYPLFFTREGTNIAAVQRLREHGFKVGVVTNGEASQEVKLRQTEIIDAVDGWCVSALVGSRKPDRHIFEEAARRCGARLAGGWMVGDAPEADIVGGHGVGLTTIWLHRERDWPLTGTRPDYVTANVPEATAIILDGLERTPEVGP